VIFTFHFIENIAQL